MFQLSWGDGSAFHAWAVESEAWGRCSVSGLNHAGLVSMGRVWITLLGVYFEPPNAYYERRYPHNSVTY